MKSKEDYFQIVGLIMVLLIGIALRFIPITIISLDGDEAASLGLSIQPLTDLFGTAKKSPTGPAYYLFMHFWLKLGSTDFLIRLPSVIFGIMTIAVAYFAGKELFDKKVALFGSMLISLSALHIFYSHIARAHSLAAFLGTLYVYYFIRALTKDNISDWAMHTAVGTLMLYTVPYLSGVILAEFIFVIAFFFRFKVIFKKLLLSQAGICALIAPLYLVTYLFLDKSYSAGDNYVALMSQMYPLGEFKNLWGYIYNFYGAFRGILDSYGFMGPGILDNTLLRKPLVLVMYLMLAVAFMKLFFQSAKSGRSPFVFFWLLIPLFLGYFCSVCFAHTLRQFRGYYYLFLSVPFYLIIAYSIISLLGSKRNILKAAAIGTAALFIIGNVYAYGNMYTVFHPPNYKEAVSFINLNIKNGEAVFCYPALLTLMVGHYRNKEYAVKGLPRDFVLRNDYGMGSKEFADARYISKEGLRRIRSSVKGYKSLWLFYFDSPFHDPEERIKKWFLKNMDVIEARTYTLHRERHRARIELFHLKNRLYGNR